MFVELGWDIGFLQYSNPPSDKILVEIAESKTKYPVHKLLRKQQSTDEELIHFIQLHQDVLYELDYFGNTAFMVARNIGASEAVLTEVLLQSWLAKKRLYPHRAHQIRFKSHVKESFVSFKIDLSISHAKVYYEIEVVASGNMQIGVAQSNWYPMSEGYQGVGDDLMSIGYDGGRRCIWNRRRTYHEQIPQWRVGTIIGVGVDMTRREVWFSADGVRIDIQPALSLSALGDEGVVAAISLRAGHAVRWNLGDAAERLRYRPCGYMSVSELVGGALYAHHIQRWDFRSLTWLPLGPDE
eukprot:gene2573-3106_t